MTATTTPPSAIVIAYGFSDAGLPADILARRDLFDRPGVAIHGRPEAYRAMARAQVFGYENPRLYSSDPAVFQQVLENPSVRLLVFDEAAQAAAVCSFGGYFPLRTAGAGKACLILAGSFGEACDSARWLATAESPPALIPAAQPGLLAALCFSLLHGPGDLEAW